MISIRNSRINSVSSARPAVKSGDVLPNHPIKSKRGPIASKFPCARGSGFVGGTRRTTVARRHTAGFLARSNTIPASAGMPKASQAASLDDMMTGRGRKWRATRTSPSCAGSDKKPKWHWRQCERGRRTAPGPGDGLPPRGQLSARDLRKAGASQFWRPAPSTHGCSSLRTRYAAYVSYRFLCEADRPLCPGRLVCLGGTVTFVTRLLGLATSADACRLSPEPLSSPLLIPDWALMSTSTLSVLPLVDLKAILSVLFEPVISTVTVR